MILQLLSTFVLGFLLRLVNITESFWHDEAIGAIIVRNDSFIEIVRYYIPLDNHPPLYYLTLDIWTNVFGYGEAGVRLLSVIFGLGSIVLVYFIYKELTGKKSIIPSLLLALMPLHIYYSQEARMYAMTAFMATATVLFFIKAINKGKAKDYILFSLFLILMMFSDYMPVFMLPVFVLYPLITNRAVFRSRSYYFSFVPLLVSGMLWIPTLLIQMANMSALTQAFPQWVSIAGGGIKQPFILWAKMILGRISFLDKNLYMAIVAISSIPFLMVLSKTFKNKLGLFPLIWFGLPVVFAFLVSFIFPAFNYFRFVFILPAFAILITLGISEIKGRWRIVLLALMIAVFCVGLYIQSFDENQKRENWKKALTSVNTRIKDGEYVLISYPGKYSGYEWYDSKNLPIIFALNSLSSSPVEIEQKILSETKTIKGIYYFEYMSGLTDINEVAKKTLEESGFRKTEILDGFRGVGQITYFKRK